MTMIDTFASQSAVFLRGLRTRSNPAKASTIALWSSLLRVHVLPAIGNDSLETFGNGQLKTFAGRLRHLSPKTQHEIVRVVKAVIASAVNENGDYLYPRVWNDGFIDLPRIDKQKSPGADSETVSKLLREQPIRYAVVYCLLAATGLRISEALSVRVGDDGNHSAWDSDASVIRVRTGIWKGRELPSPKTRSSIREVDLHPEVNQVLQSFAANMNHSKGDFLFAGQGTSRPITDSVIRANLRSAGVSFSLHGFRRYRISHLRRMRCQEDLVKLWAGHAPGSMTDHYVRLADDIEFRKKTVSEVGLGFEIPDRLLTMPSCESTPPMPTELISCSPEMETVTA